MTVRRICQQWNRYLAFIGFIAYCAIGCAGLKPAALPLLPENVPPQHELAAVPFYPQEAYQCGPAALAMALSWSGLHLKPDDLVDEVYTPARKGSLQMAMIGATRRHGRIAYEISGADGLFPEIAAGRPVVILQNLGLSLYPVWHYALVIGYDLPQKKVMLHTGVTSRKSMPYGVFEKTWARSQHWGFIVLPPNQLPARATERSYVKAVLGLEKARQYQAAKTGYHTALQRWPASLPALMGLGNSYYALGNIEQSAHAFQTAARLHPEEGAAYNNLAHVLMEQGKKQAALQAARKAVALGGPMSNTYKKTLADIEQKVNESK
jgi:hypothetical protein